MMSSLIEYYRNGIRSPSSTSLLFRILKVYLLAQFTYQSQRYKW